MPHDDVNFLFAYKLADVPYTRQVLLYRNTPVHRSLNIVEALLLGIVSQILTWATDHIHPIATFLEIRKLVSDKIRENKVDVNYVKDIHKNNTPYGRLSYTEKPTPKTIIKICIYMYALVEL